MNKSSLEKLKSRKFLIAVGAILLMAGSKEIGIDAGIVKLIVVVAVGYIGTEGTLDLVAIFKAMFKPEESSLPLGK